MNYKIVDDYFIVLDKEKIWFLILELVILTMRSILILSFNDRESVISSKYLIDRMIEPTHFKPKKVRFCFEEYLKCKGIDFPFDFLYHIRK